VGIIKRGDLMTFGKNLQSFRKRNKLSQEKIAELIGVCRQAVSKWENGLAYPDIENLMRLSDLSFLHFHLLQCF